jgi:hypothetical protein
MDVDMSELNKKKRGRKKKTDEPDQPATNIQIVIEDSVDAISEPTETAAKKRGRKPKGGKLTLNCPKKNETVNSIANIILHLKCSLNDLNEYNHKINKMVKNPLEYDPSIPPNISTYNTSASAAPFSVYDHERHTNSSYMNENTTSSIVDQCMLQTSASYLDSINYSLLNTSSVSEQNVDSESALKPLSCDLGGTEASFTRRSDDVFSGNGYAVGGKFAPSHPHASLSVNNDTPAYLDAGLFSSANPKYANAMLGGSIATAVAKDIADIEGDTTNIKDINAKLKKLKIHLYKNINYEKKSACFWCTYDYDNPTCYIPKYEMDDKIYGYGSFCRPECAVAYLMKENIDDSMKFERYHLLNQIYSKVYDFKKNIKPAPNPYYLLEKYYGNLTIQEYRKLLKTEHMLLVIDKPLTRILPELHEDNEDILLNTYASGNSNHTAQNNTGVYKVKRSTDKTAGPSKASIIKDSFGLA